MKVLDSLSSHPAPSRHSRTMTIYNNILETVGGTPVIKVNKLGPEGVDIYVKCEFFNPCGSVKDR